MQSDAERCGRCGRCDRCERRERAATERRLLESLLADPWILREVLNRIEDGLVD